MGNTKIKVAKFGGSSLADAAQFRKVKEIVESDPARRYVVPSAPGRRSSGDEKEMKSVERPSRSASTYFLSLRSVRVIPLLKIHISKTPIRKQMAAMVKIVRLEFCRSSKNGVYGTMQVIFHPEE